MRTAFIKTLTTMARKDIRIYLLTGDLGFSVIENFRKEFPDRFFNVGIAEQTMIGVAAGLALSGKTVFTYSIASFITMRCFEQIRNDLCYHNLKVRIIGVGSGFSYSTSGITHHSLSDIAIMRSLPNMTIIVPGDPVEVERAMEKSDDIEGPIYFRLGKTGEPKLHSSISEFTIGKGLVMKEGDDIALITCGSMLEVTKSVAEVLEKKGLSVKVISMHTVKPIDENLILNTASKIKYLFTIEEHNIIGGLGSAVAEILSEAPSREKMVFKRIGVEDKFCIVAGNRNYIRDLFDISKEKIVSHILSIVGLDKTKVTKCSITSSKV